MATAALTFWAGRRRYVRVPPTGLRAGLRHTLGPGESRAALRRVLTVFAFVPALWMLNEQTSSEWVLQATHLNRELWPGFRPLAEQLQVTGIALKQAKDLIDAVANGERRALFVQGPPEQIAAHVAVLRAACDVELV